MPLHETFNRLRCAGRPLARLSTPTLLTAVHKARFNLSSTKVGGKCELNADTPASVRLGHPTRERLKLCNGVVNSRCARTVKPLSVRLTQPEKFKSTESRTCPKAREGGSFLEVAFLEEWFKQSWQKLFPSDPSHKVGMSTDDAAPFRHHAGPTN